MAEVAELPRNGESWFKNQRLKYEMWKSFSHDPGMDTLLFKNEIPNSALKSKW